MVKTFNRFFLAALVTSFGVNALTQRIFNLDELADRSNRVVLGTVTSVEESPAAKKQLPAIVVRIAVSETLKGTAQKEVTLRQFATTGPEGKLRVAYGLPLFRKGERVVVFLRTSAENALASPVGLGQGVFRVLGDKPDSPIVNETQNRTLFHGKISASTQRAVTRLNLPVESGKAANLNVSQLKEILRERATHAK